MDGIKFTHCVVAFLDILGFKDFIEAAERVDSPEFRQFCELQDVISRQLNFTKTGSADSRGGEQHLFPKDVGLQVVHVSDSFVLSAPICSEVCAGYSGVVAVAIKSIQMAHQLLTMGFLVRGGLAVGNLYRTGSNIFGTGYQAAYETERRAATPRVLFHQSAVARFETESHLGIPLWGLSIFAKDGDEVILDTLATNWSYVGAEPGADVTQTFRSHRKMIERRLSELRPGRAREKWEWMAKYFNAKQRNSNELTSIGYVDVEKSSHFRFGPLISHSESTLQDARTSFYAPGSEAIGCNKSPWVS